MYVKGKRLSLSCLVLALLPSIVMATQDQDNKAGAALKAIDSTKTAPVTVHAAIKPAETKNIVTTGGNDMPMRFPPWPPRQSFNHSMLPPPPPGPYMSTALNNTPMQVPVPNRPVYSPPIMRSPPVMNEGAEPMAMFSPDLPWPGDRVSHQWKPENGGYHYARPAFPPGHPPVKENGYRPYQPALPPRSVRPPDRMNTGMQSSRHMYNGPAMMQPGMPPRFRPPAYPPASAPPYHHSQTGYLRTPRQEAPAGNVNRGFNAPAMMNSAQYQQ